MTKHLILDFETFGKEVSDCAVIDCSFFVFDTEKMLSEKPYTCRSIVDMKRSKLSVQHQVKTYGWKVYQDTIKFWSEQSKEVQKKIAPKNTDLTVEEFADEFFRELNLAGSVSYWWSRSSSFDPLILWRLMKAVKLDQSVHQHLPHWKQRDTRTYIDAKFNFPVKNAFIPIQDEVFWSKVFQEHDSSWDILADILRMQAIMRAEEDLAQIER